MNQENQGTNPAASENLPVKRKRGRPRKDERPVHGAKASSTPEQDTLKRNRQRTNPAPDIGNAMVGQVVSGVLDGKFEAGYLLTVRVGDTNTILRGVVFEPGKSVPVSGANDVAPHIHMLRRNDIPLPVVNSQVPMHGSTPQSEQKQPTQVFQRNEDSLPPKVSHPVTQVSKATIQVLPSQLQTKPIEVQNDTSHAPQAAAPQALKQAEIKAKTSDIMPRSLATESVIEKKKSTNVLPEDKAGLPPKVDISNNDQPPIITPQQAAECDLNKEPASATQTSPSKQNKTIEPAVVLLNNEAPSVSEAPRDSRLEPATEPSVEVPSKTVDDQVSRGGSEAVGSELKPDMQIDDASMSLEPEFNLTTATDGSELKPDMQIDDASKSLEPDLNFSTPTDGSELTPDMQIDDASESLEPELNLNAATNGSELKPEMQIDDASKSLEPELNLTTATDGYEHKPDMPIDDASNRLEPKLNLSTAADEYELNPAMQIDDASNRLESELNLTTSIDGSEHETDQLTVGELKDKAVDINLTLVATNGSELEPEMQIDDASKNLELELNLTTATYGSEHETDRCTVGELKDKAVDINCTLVATAPEAVASLLSTAQIMVSQENGTLQKSELLQDTESKVPMEIARTDEATKSEPQLEPRVYQQVGVLQREEAIPGARNGSEEEDLSKPNVLSKDEPESKTSELNVPIAEEEDDVFMDAAALVQTQSSLSESNNDTDSIGGTEKVDLN